MLPLNFLNEVAKRNRLTEAQTNVINEGKSLLYIGVNYRDLGEYQESVLFLHQGRKIAHESGNRKLQDDIFYHLLKSLAKLEKQ
jgi:hypothetical protein